MNKFSVDLILAFHIGVLEWVKWKIVIFEAPIKGKLFEE